MSVDGTTIITGDGDSDSEEEVESTDVAGQEVVSTDVAGQESQGSLKMEDLNVSKEGSQVDLAQDTTTNIEGEGEGEDKSVSSEDLASGEGEAGKYGPEDQIKSAATSTGNDDSFNIKEDKLGDELDALPDPNKVSVGMAELNDNLKSVATVSDMKVTENGDLEITYTPNMTGGKRKTKRRKNMKKNKSQKKKRKQTKKKGGKKAKKANTRKCA